MNKINTKMTLNKMKEWIQKNIVNESEEYVGMHKNINQNEPDDINENELYEKKFAHISDTRVSIEGSDLR